MRWSVDVKGEHTTTIQKSLVSICTTVSATRSFVRMTNGHTEAGLSGQTKSSAGVCVQYPICRFRAHDPPQPEPNVDRKLNDGLRWDGTGLDATRWDALAREWVEMAGEKKKETGTGREREREGTGETPSQWPPPKEPAERPHTER